MNAKHFWGTVTIVVIIGGTIYAIKKSKDAQKDEGEEISLEEAKTIVARKKEEDVKIMSRAYEIMEGYEEAIAIVARKKEETDGKWVEMELTHFNEKNMHEYVEEDVKIMSRAYEIMEEYDEEEEEYEETPDPSDFITSNDTNPKEEEELRYEPNSREARNQFIKMELAEWLPLEDNYQTMLKLFEFPFFPQNDGDEMLRTQVIDYRARFFGFESQWTKQVSIADIILHYGRAAEFQVGECVKHWVDYFLEFNEFTLMTPNHEIDDMIQRLNSHTYYNQHTETFGLFGLTRQGMDQAIRIANRNIDQSVTYEIEFNEFLKSCL